MRCRIRCTGSRQRPVAVSFPVVSPIFGLPPATPPQHVAGHELTREQAAAVHARLERTIGYLCRLRERMTKVGFEITDPLYQQVRKAEDAMMGLGVMLHYRSCERGTGQPPDRTNRGQ
jgi:hypothetical protein